MSFTLLYISILCEFNKMNLTPLCQHLLTMLTMGCTATVWRRLVEGEGGCKLGWAFPFLCMLDTTSMVGPLSLLLASPQKLFGIPCFWFHDA